MNARNYLSGLRRALLIASPLAVLVLALSSAACSRHRAVDDASQDREPIAQCDSFLTAYEHCLASLGDAATARARVEQTRASFATQLAGGAGARTALREKCASNLSQLQSTCR